MARNVLFVVLPDVVLLDVAGAAEAFRLANLQQAGSFALRFVSPLRQVRSAIGLQLEALESLPDRVPADSLIVIAGVTSKALDLDSTPVSQVAQWLERQAQGPSITIMCVCSGALFAAKAGLLRERECTTHHELLKRLQALEPSALVHDNRIFVQDGCVYTSAGVTAGLDLALHLIGESLGHRVAASVARDLVVYMRRSGSDPQLSPWLMHRNHLHPAVHKVQDAIARNPAAAWSSRRLANLACMSPRHLARLFAAHAGCSPLDYVQRLRVAVAREFVSHSELALERVAEKVGFTSAHQLRRVWRRWERMSPRELRAAVQASRPVES